ncbi:hypothetical protein P7C71_g6499, partial [Lecanoromycetidae sp. Uapishka_2]
MSLTLSYCKPEDAPQISEIAYFAFENNPRFKVMYGKVSQATLLSWGKDLYRNIIASQQDQNASQQRHCLKITDPESGEILAFAIWSWLPNGYKPEEDYQAQVSYKGWPQGIQEALARDYPRRTGQLRSEHPGRSKEHWHTSEARAQRSSWPTGTMAVRAGGQRK